MYLQANTHARKIRLRNRVNLCRMYVRVLQLNNGLVLEFKIIFYKLVPKCPKDTSAEVSWVRSVCTPVELRVRTASEAQ